MSSIRKQLQAFLELAPDSPGNQAPLPRLDEVAYQGPDSNGQPKMCQTCCLYLGEETSRCAIHAADSYIEPNAVCSYYVFGEPTPKLRLNVVDFLEPETSGLVETSRGASCGACRWYSAQGKKSGLCAAVMADEGGPAVVEALGCCSRWEEGDAS